MGGVVFPPCYSLGLIYGGGNEDNALLQKVPCTHCTQCPQPCSTPLPTHTSTLTGKSGSVSYGVTAPFSWVLVHTRFCLCPPRVCFPVLCKFWLLCGGVNGDLLQEDLCHTQSPCLCSRPLLTRISAGDTQTQSLWGLLVHTGFVWAFWVCLGGLGFGSKCNFTLSTILLGLLLCPWTWGIFFWWDWTFSCR